MQTEFNDNRHLTTADHPSVWGAIAEAGVALGVRSEVSGLSIDPTYTAARYTGESGLDHYDKSVSMNAYHKGETDTWNMDADYVLDSTLISELLDSGRTQFNKQRQFLNLQPSWSMQWSPRSTVSLAGGYSTTRYNDGLSVGLVNYATSSAQASMSYSLSETQQVGVTASLSRFEAPDLYNNKSNNYDLRATWHDNWTQRLETNFSGGVQVNESKLSVFGLTLKDTQHGFVADALARYNAEQMTWTASASRRVDPSSLGVLAARDQVNLSMSKPLSEHVRGSVSATWLHSKSLQNNVVADDRTWYEIDWRVRWAFSPTLALLGNYTWMRQEIAGSAQANSVTISISYTGLEHSISR